MMRKQSMHNASKKYNTQDLTLEFNATFTKVVKMSTRHLLLYIGGTSYFMDHWPRTLAGFTLSCQVANFQACKIGNYLFMNFISPPTPNL